MHEDQHRFRSVFREIFTQPQKLFLIQVAVCLARSGGVEQDQMNLTVIEGTVPGIIFPLFDQRTFFQVLQIVVVPHHGVHGNLEILEQIGDCFILALLPIVKKISPQHDQIRFWSLFFQCGHRLHEVGVGKCVVHTLPRLVWQVKIRYMCYAHQTASLCVVLTPGEPAAPR
ncbi:hypothetical protein ES708_03119 [subsurface metagenome]